MTVYNLLTTIFFDFFLPPLVTFNHCIILQSGGEKVASDCSEKQVITTDITEVSYGHEEIVVTQVEGGEYQSDNEDQMSVTEPDYVPTPTQGEVVLAEEEGILSKNEKQMATNKTNDVVTPKKGKHIVDQEVLPSIENDKDQTTKAGHVPHHITHEDDVVTKKVAMSSQDINIPVTDNLSPEIVASSPSTPPGLRLSVLKNEMKIKPHVKTRGRPKHSGTIWLSKSKTKCKRKKPSTSLEKENLPPNKKVCVEMEIPVAKRNHCEPGNPAYLVKMRRKCVKDSKSQDVIKIDLDKYESSEEGMESPEFTINGQNIYRDDLQILKDDHKWLNERLINAGQQMLLEKFPHTAGLHDICFSDTLAFPCDPPKDVVHILNVANAHWVCVSSKECKPGTIKVYDSMRSGDLPLSVKEVIAALVKSDKKIFLLFPDVQQQPNSSSCGLFDLAFASTLCEG